MDFAWTKAQNDAYDKAAAFAQSLNNADAAARDQALEFSSDDWRRCAEFGVQALSSPGAYHKHGETEFMTALRIMEALGYGCEDAGLTFALNAQMWTVQLPLVEAGSDFLKQKYLPGLCDGSLIGAHVITEPESGSDAFSLQTSATRSGDGYLLNGDKCYISLAPIADLGLVFATVDPSAGKWGVTAFLVELNTAGCTRSATKSKMGLRTVPIGDIAFRDCWIPESARIGPEGAGLSLSTSFLEWERCCILASQLGIMQRQLETSLEFAKNRKQFGQSIGKFQAVSHRLAEMRVRLETAQLLLYKTAWLKQSGQPAMLEAAMLKLHLSECFAESSLDAVRVHGGAGYMTENNVERDLRDAVGGLIYAGTSDIQKNIIARLLGL